MANMEYTNPDVYVRSVPQSVPAVITATSGTIGGLIGRTQRGVRNVPVKITSWAEYLEQFAYGMPSAFIPTSYLAYAVYGFFQNGGSELYILSEADDGLKKATAIVGGISLEASDEGAWAGDGKSATKLMAQLVADPSGAEHTFVLNVYYGDTATDDTFKEAITLVGVDDEADGTKITAATLKSAINASSYVRVVSTVVDDVTLTADVAAVGFTGGADGTDMGEGVLKPVDVSTSLHKFDNIDDISMIAHADDNTEKTAQTILDYCWSTNERRNLMKLSHNNLVAVLGVESETTTVDDAISLDLKGRGTVVFPWGGFLDTLTGETKMIPLVGHHMGRIAQMINSEGFQRVPAGVTAAISGIVSTSQEIDSIQSGKLNAANICSVVMKNNYGFVLWGGRSKDDGRYINSLLLEAKIRRDLYNGLQSFIFRPNTQRTRSAVADVTTSYMMNLWNNGTFNGSTPSSAFCVVCDETNNTAATIAKKELHLYVAYREVDCAELVIVDIYRTLDELQ